MLIEKSTLVEIVHEATAEFEQPGHAEERKKKGQFFTPVAIAQFMARQFHFRDHHLRILDPGAGTGILTAAVCDQVLLSADHSMDIELVAYETDDQVKPVLQETYGLIQDRLTEAGHSVEYTVHPEDFVSDNAALFNNGTLFDDNSQFQPFNFIISNPPYYKLQKSHPLSKQMAQIVHGQPNIYAFFMAVAAKLLADSGQMVFITPRSFCSGLYFKEFRKWLLKRLQPTFLHSFESRNETFENKVLQETIISKYVKSSDSRDIIISHSYNANFNTSSELWAKKEALIQSDDREKIIHIPSNVQDLEILEIVRNWKHRFMNLGYKISTGPVVKFRATEYIDMHPEFDGEKRIPLLWMNHFENYHIVFPKLDLDKPQVLRVSSDSFNLVLDNQNYVLVKRFSSKEQKRRVYAAIYLAEQFDIKYVTFENHLNYVWKPGGELTKTEAFGIMTLLNSTLIDRYFRIVNGNTQVNAGEINHMPFPQREKVEAVGRRAQRAEELNQQRIDSIIHSELELPLQAKEL